MRRQASGASGGWECDAVELAHLHQGPGSGVTLELLEAPARDPDEERIAVSQPGGGEGVDELFCTCEGESGPQFGSIPQLGGRGFTYVSDTGMK